MAGGTPVLMALDAGTGSIRAALFEPNGRMVALAQREYIHPATAQPGGLDFDTAHNWKLALTCISQAIADWGGDPADIAAISTTSMREGMVLYGPDGSELWACPNADARGVEEAAELIRTGLAAQIYDTAGDWVAITAPPRLLWLRRHAPELMSQVRHMTMLSDWLLFKLCGEFVTDPTVASSSALVDLEARDWSVELVEACGLDPAVLPQIVEPGSVVGAVKSEVASATGLLTGTPVVVGGADTQLGLLGQGIVDSSTVTVLGGSFWQTTAIHDRPIIDPQRRLRTLCHVTDGSWMQEGIGFWSGLAMRWVRDALLDPDRTLGGSAWERSEAMVAAVPPGSNGVWAILSNVMQADRWRHAAPGFLGIDITDPAGTGLAAMARATMEAAAYVSRAHMEILEELRGGPFSNAVFAGGASASRTWRRIVAATLDRPTAVPSTKEATALGCAICAGVGAGIWSDLATGAAAVRSDQEQVDVTDEERTAYAGLYLKWKQVYPAMTDLTERTPLQPMWAAPGSELSVER